MSHLVTGKIECKCSLDLLRRALLKRFPEWADAIITSAEGNLSITNYSGTTQGQNNYSLIVPGSQRTRSSGAKQGAGTGNSDIGFKLASNGSWEIEKDDYEMRGKYKDITGNLAHDIGREKASIALQRLKAEGITVRSAAGKTIIEADIEESEIRALLS